MEFSSLYDLIGKKEYFLQLAQFKSHKRKIEDVIEFLKVRLPSSLFIDWKKRYIASIYNSKIYSCTIWVRFIFLSLRRTSILTKLRSIQFSSFTRTFSSKIYVLSKNNLEKYPKSSRGRSWLLHRSTMPFVALLESSQIWIYAWSKFHPKEKKLIWLVYFGFQIKEFGYNTRVSSPKRGGVIKKILKNCSILEMKIIEIKQRITKLWPLEV